jgi:Gas vesicle protein
MISRRWRAVPPVPAEGMNSWTVEASGLIHGGVRADGASNKGLAMRSDRTSMTGLAELLDRVLDKGLVVAGDIHVCIAELELLTIRIRLIVCSIDKAREVGLEWWRYDSHFSGGSGTRARFEELERRVRLLNRRIARLTPSRAPSARLSRGRPAQRVAR